MGHVKHMNRDWLADLEPKDWSNFTDYFAGERVAKLPDAFVPWSLVLDYEKQCRKAAYELVVDTKISLKETVVQVN